MCDWMHKIAKIEKVLLNIKAIFCFVMLYLIFFKNIFTLKLLVLIFMVIIDIITFILKLKSKKLKNEVLELARESERESERELAREILEDKMKEEEFFIELRNLIWNEFPYCRLNKIKTYDTLICLNKDFEDTIIIDVDFVYLNIGKHLRYQIKENDIRKKGKKLEKELSARVLYDIKNLQKENIE
jgi:hypothetical protein